jgi:hypothetical protein
MNTFPSIVNGDEGELLEILGDAEIPDEVENADGACYPGWIRVDTTDMPARLLAWRDAAINTAQATLDAEIKALRARIASLETQIRHAAPVAVDFDELRRTAQNRSGR